ncbi:hypothetical protein Y032_0398g735 [Ancylostoma ceylanicum]|uniref:Transmembrane protein n=1 Tax=Ancylostoma ceylanicum TaxID=53326 RepID=A0A016RRE8_9BILA|nr:hypothetical protein Y032_0398g735 [Ancylostoma ceylanicum]
MDDEPSPSHTVVKGPIIKVPRNQRENRLYKQDFVDDNNVHLSYFNFRILWPVMALSVFMYAFFIGE